MTDHLRLRILADLSRAFGPNWPARWREPEKLVEAEALKHDPYSCQWGHLVQTLGARPSDAVRSRWLPAARETHRIRNELAHYRPITSPQFKIFIRELSSLPA